MGATHTLLQALTIAVRANRSVDIGYPVPPWSGNCIVLVLNLKSYVHKRRCKFLGDKCRRFLSNIP